MARQRPRKIGSANQVEMSVDWTVTGSQSGWIVQYVTIERRAYRDSDNSEFTVSSLDYFEAWQVSNGTADGGDLFRSPSFPDSTYGDWTMTGIANFFTDSQINENSPATWGANVAQANGLPSYLGGSGPSWWSSAGAASHWLSMTWE